MHLRDGSGYHLNMQNYASISILEQMDDSNIAVWKVSVSIDGVDLSGAWVFSSQEFESKIGILDGSLIIETTKTLKNRKLLEPLKAQKVDVSDFLSEARNDVELGNIAFEKFIVENEREYSEYMAVDPTARKLLPKVQKKQLLAPNFCDWPENFQLNQAIPYLESHGKAGVTKAERLELSNILGVARLIQLFVQMWQADEKERKNRVYVQGQSAEVTILPRCWLEKLAN
jgi:hypothetical protein